VTNEENIERIADAVEGLRNLYLVYLYAAFGFEHINEIIDQVVEGEEE
jgi:hypothetical protein